MSARDRIVWVDVAKGVAIVLMVFGHVWRGLFEAGVLTNSALFEPVDRAIYLFHMPLFFFLSGMFLSSGVTTGTFIPQLLKRASAYLYPLLVWSWILALSRVAAGDSTNRAALSLWDAVLYPFPPKDIFWFLWALFLMQSVIACALLLPRRMHLPLAGTAIVLSVAYIASGINLPLVHDTISYLPYFLAGTAFAAIGGVTAASDSQGLLGLTLFVASEVVALLLPVSTAGVSALALGMLAVVGAALLIAWLCARFRANWPVESFAALGTATMAIYVAHVIVLAAVRIGLTKFGIHDVLTHTVVATVAATALPVVMLHIASRLHLNRVLGLGPPFAMHSLGPLVSRRAAKP